MRNIIYPTLLAIAMVLGIFIGILSVRKTPDGTGTSSRLRGNPYADNKLAYTLSLIDRLYVDSVSLDTLTDKAIEKLLEELDPHSTYIPADHFAEANEALDGQFDGIGVVFNMATDTVRVLNVIAGGPSDKAGVRNGDRIIKVNDSLVAGQKINQNDIVKMLRGQRGTKVVLALQRQGIDELVPVTVVRGIIPVKSLDAAFMLKPTVGFIKLSAFSKNSLREINYALEKLKGQGMTSLIFDLRGNSGGFLDQAISIANEFLPQRELIVYTVDRYQRRTEEHSNGKGRYTDLPLIILVDEGSASSSEILAGAIQDNDRGLIIGRRTFGKGLVQQQLPYKDGSALRLTIARYYTPTGRSIQKPYDDGNDEYRNDFLNRFQHSEFFTADSIKFNDSMKFTTPAGRTVYGGGGIMPDVFVPLDTSRMTQYYLEVSGKNILYKYTIEYTDRNRDKLNAVSTFEELDKILNDQAILSEFIAYASRQGVKTDYSQISVSRNLMLAQIKAYIARNTSLEDNAFYYYISPIDNTVQEALNHLNN